MTKDPVDRSSTLSIAAAAKQQIGAFASLADDSKTAVRTAQHHLNVIMNKFNGYGEYSLMFAAYALLGGPPEPCTHRTINLNVSAALSRSIAAMCASGMANQVTPD